MTRNSTSFFLIDLIYSMTTLLLMLVGGSCILAATGMKLMSAVWSVLFVEHKGADPFSAIVNMPLWFFGMGVVLLLFERLARKIFERYMHPLSNRNQP